jgi:nucleoside-diphosphate-sugar epimerase
MHGDDFPLVTVLGASGFVGSEVIDLLAHRPIRLRAVARRMAKVPHDARADIEVRTTDLTEPGELAHAVSGAHAVIHLLAHRDDAGDWRVSEATVAERTNVTTVRDLVSVFAAAGGPPPVVLFAGTTALSGRTTKRRVDGSEPDRPESEYDRQKWQAEQTLRRATEQGVLRASTLRLPTVYGAGACPDAPGRGVVSAMVRRAIAGHPLTLWHDGTVERDLLHVRDVARAFLAALDHAEPLAGRHWVLGSGHGVPLRRILEIIAYSVARQIGRSPAPIVAVRPPPNASPADFHGVEIDAGAFRSVTGWEPLIPLTNGIEHAVQVALATSAAQK